MTPRIEPATVEHIAAIAARVRKEDLDELWGFGCVSPEYAMFHGLRYSDFARTGFVDDEPICMFGVVPVDGSPHIGRPWMVGTDALDRYAKAFLRRCRGQVDEMMGLYSRLENVVDARNKRAIDWLRWLGFSFSEAETTGIFSLPFIPFYKERTMEQKLAVAVADTFGDILISEEEMKVKILALEQLMVEVKDVEVFTTREGFGLEVKPTYLPPKHHYADGLYARELFIPAGTLLTGKIHKFEHLNIVSQGTIRVWTEDGMKEVTAPCHLVSKPGMKRLGYAVTDTVWTTIHAITLDEGTDPDTIEDLLVCNSFEEYEHYMDSQQSLLTGRE